jgi:drug/metabolite transporter (DMT)-like permease
MKLLALGAVLVAAVMLLGTRRDTPFIRWGMALALLGILLVVTSARAISAGAVLAILGACAYYYGRLVRHEQIFVAKK